MLRVELSQAYCLTDSDSHHYCSIFLTKNVTFTLLSTKKLLFVCSWCTDRFTPYPPYVLQLCLPTTFQHSSTLLTTIHVNRQVTEIYSWVNLKNYSILGGFAKLWETTIALSSLSVHQLGTTRLSVDGFSWNLIFEYTSKIRREN